MNYCSIIPRNKNFYKRILKKLDHFAPGAQFVLFLCRKSVCDDEQELDSLEFQSDSDCNLLIGESTNVKVILFDDDDELFSGSLPPISPIPTGDPGLLFGIAAAAAIIR